MSTRSVDITYLGKWRNRDNVDSKNPFFEDKQASVLSRKEKIIWFFENFRRNL